MCVHVFVCTCVCVCVCVCVVCVEVRKLYEMVRQSVPLNTNTSDSIEVVTLISH